AFLNRGLRISLTDERPAKVVSDDAEDDTLLAAASAASAVGKARTVVYEYPGGIADFVRYLNASKEPVHAQVIEFGDEQPGMSAELAMQWNGWDNEAGDTFAHDIDTA